MRGSSIFNGAMTLLLQSLRRFSISFLTLSFIHGDDKNHDLVINDLVDQPITAASQLDFVAIRKGVKAIRFNARV